MNKPTANRSILNQTIAFRRVFVGWTGSINAALMLSQLVYWSERTKDSNRWIYKTAEEWEKEIGLHKWEQRTARRQLRQSQLVEEKLFGLPPIVHFRLTKEYFKALKSWGKTSCAETSKLGKKGRLES